MIEFNDRKATKVDLFKATFGLLFPDLKNGTSYISRTTDCKQSRFSKQQKICFSLFEG